MRFLLLLALVARTAHADEPHEFLADAQELLVVGACADGTPTKVPQAVVTAHCKKVKSYQASYKAKWLAPANEFFRAHVPKDVSKTVVYPFAGGDLATALTIYPDADEITTLSLEPAGDPRALSQLTPAQVKTQLAVAASELSYLYTVNFSKTNNMKTAMRSSQLPTQLVFSLSALWMHGYEPTRVRYYKLSAEGEVTYLTDVDLAAIDAIEKQGERNSLLANVEIVFRKIGTKREQTYRHLVQNLDNKHLQAEPAALKFLEKKGKFAAMTKAASYLMAKSSFSMIRTFLLDHVTWMVSDTTGIAPKWGKKAGFEYETHGKWEAPNMTAGFDIAPDWRALYKSQPARPLKFRFGYTGGMVDRHLVIMKKKS